MLNRLAPVLLAAGALLAQQGGPHTFTPADIEEGGRLYRTSCASCHGPDGDRVQGIDLGHARFRRAASDDDAIRFIRSGIPGTAMPPSNLSELQAGMIVAYFHSIAGETSRKPALTGDPARGATLYAGKGGCRNCHRIKGEGSRLGPDLSEIGSSRRTSQLETALLDPDAEIAAQNRPFRVVTKAGATITGRLLNEDAFTIQVFDSKEQLLSLDKTDLREYSFVDKSPMPSFRDKLSQQELADVVSYLTTLKTPEKPAAAGRGGSAAPR